MSSGTVNDPSEDDVNQFLVITDYGLNRDECVRRLKSHNNDLANAINEYLNDPSSDKYRWEESQFSADRQGEANDAAFNIQGPDEMAMNSYHGSAAPTRPPSRANNKSPLGAAPTSTAQEDADLRKALLDSIADAGIESGPPPQETGVVDDLSGTHFGPANRPVYDANQWAMVPSKLSAQFTSPDPSPSLRKRIPGAPAFLIQTADHRLGAILSILHSIPLGRNILLRFGAPAPSYGYHDEWWKGEPIARPGAQISPSEATETPGLGAGPSFGDEVHRLMAFLDQTERSYGSADALVQTHSMGAISQDQEHLFFNLLRDESIANPGSGLGAVMMKGRVLPVVPPPLGAVEDSAPEDREVNFAVLDLNMDYEQSGWVNNLYDALDQLLWASALSPTDPFPDKADFAVLMKPADILNFRFTGVGITKPCEMPAVFYADRYIHDRKDEALHFQRQIFELRRNGIQKLRQWEQNATRCRAEDGCPQSSWLGQHHDVRVCCEKRISIAAELLERQTKDAQWRHYDGMWHKDMTYSMSDLESLHTGGGPVNLTVEEDRQRIAWEKIIKTSRDKLDLVSQTVADCHERLQAYNDSLTIINKRLTCQESEAEDDAFVFKSDPTAYHPEYWNPTHKYTLRGVALTDVLSYICIRGEGDLMELDDQRPPEDQWWKISRPTKDSTKVDFERVTAEDAIHAAGTESKFPLLIYASEAAMSTHKEPLSDALRMFTRADNRSFENELAQEGKQQPESDTELPEMTSHLMGRWGERKVSNGSSLATNGSPRSNLSEVDFGFTEDQNLTEGMERDHSEFPAPGEIESSGQTEMQERVGGSGHLSFLARPGNVESPSAPIDLIDIDMDPDRKGG